MDRLIALVGLRWRMGRRATLGGGAGLVALLLAVPGLLLFSATASLFSFFLVRLLAQTRPDLLLPVLSAAAAVFGFSWALSPLLAGIAATETHDLTRLLQYPVALPALVVSSLLANLLQPMLVAQLPPAVALALALGGPGWRWPLSCAGVLLTLALTLACGQAVGLLLHAVSRHRRWHDRAMLAGVGLGLVASLLPLLVLTSGDSAGLRRLLGWLLAADVLEAVPFAWGVRAAVYAGRGEIAGFLAWSAAAALAVAAAVAVSTVIARQIYGGELVLGDVGPGPGVPARMRLPGRVGTLLEKDLLVTWRDPRLKVLVFTGLIGPALVLLAVWRGTSGQVPAGVLLSLGSVAGLGVLGANHFGVERRALPLLFSFPVERLSILVAKNLVTIVLRLPALALVGVATALVAGPALVFPVLTIALSTELVAAAVDNYVSVLAPIPVPAAGRDPSRPVSGVRGLGAALTAFAGMLAALLVSTPFVFLAWLPHLLGEPWLWAATLPLTLAGAAGVYFMLTAGAARLVERREPDLIVLAGGEGLA